MGRDALAVMLKKVDCIDGRGDWDSDTLSRVRIYLRRLEFPETKPQDVFKGTAFPATFKGDDEGNRENVDPNLGDGIAPIRETGRVI